ncbi:MAG: hypothetical protein U9Q07_05355, partial [Planctomycetota bacterium]|nr:hypothetical protein [Planctomycetota bacterium]
RTGRGTLLTLNSPPAVHAAGKLALVNGRIALMLDGLLTFLAKPCNIAAYTLDGLAADYRKDNSNQSNYKKHFSNHLFRPPSTLGLGST